jgi:hypothetical protein
MRLFSGAGDGATRSKDAFSGADQLLQYSRSFIETGYILTVETGYILTVIATNHFFS